MQRVRFVKMFLQKFILKRFTNCRVIWKQFLWKWWSFVFNKLKIGLSFAFLNTRFDFNFQDLLCISFWWQNIIFVLVRSFSLKRFGLRYGSRRRVIKTIEFLTLRAMSYLKLVFSYSLRKSLNLSGGFNRSLRWDFCWVGYHRWCNTHSFWDIWSVRYVMSF